MQMYSIKMAPEPRVIMCASNNPVRYVQREPMNTKNGPCFEFACAGSTQACSPWESFNTGDLVILV